jgi:hypothetical protein
LAAWVILLRLARTVLSALGLGATTDMQDEIDRSALQAVLMITKVKARKAHELCAKEAIA